LSIRKTRKHTLVLSVIAALSLGAGCGGGAEGLQISEARVGAPTGPNAALYFTARGGPDALLSASTDVAGDAQIHETVIGEEGTMSMRQVPRLEVPAGGELVLEPGGFHVMLVGIDELQVGATIEITLVWENAGEVTVDAEVVEPSNTIHDMEDE
jgi:copper(I)-binding protein